MPTSWGATPSDLRYAVQVFGPAAIQHHAACADGDAGRRASGKIGRGFKPWPPATDRTAPTVVAEAVETRPIRAPSQICSAVLLRVGSGVTRARGEARPASSRGSIAGVARGATGDWVLERVGDRVPRPAVHAVPMPATSTTPRSAAPTSSSTLVSVHRCRCFAKPGERLVRPNVRVCREQCAFCPVTDSLVVTASAMELDWICRIADGPPVGLVAPSTGWTRPRQTRSRSRGRRLGHRRPLPRGGGQRSQRRPRIMSAPLLNR